MLRKAGQTAGPIGLNFFVDNYRLKKSRKKIQIFSKKIFSNFYSSTGNTGLFSLY